MSMIYAQRGFFIVLLIVLSLAAVAIVVTSVVGSKGRALKKTGVAWILVIVMIAVSVGIGQAKANSAPRPESRPDATAAPSTVQPVSPAQQDSYVYDDAGVLSSSTVKKLDKRNEKLMQDMNVVIAVVTCNYGRSDLYHYALERAEEMELGEYDFIVTLDISGENYWLVQGSGLYNEVLFSDVDCSEYAQKYMEKDFARGDYDDAVLSLTEALEEWYYDNY